MPVHPFSGVQLIITGGMPIVGFTVSISSSVVPQEAYPTPPASLVIESTATVIDEERKALPAPKAGGDTE